MGILDKFKNLLYEEEDVEEEKPIDIPVPPPTKNTTVLPENKQLKEEEIEEVISERELFKTEKTFKFPVMFDEEDSESEEKERNVLYQKEVVIEEERIKRDFHVSPIVSPIYGILDKDYKKNQIREKSKEKEKVIEEEKGNKDVITKEINIDEIREKAYGTLEDELERTMSDEEIILPIEEELEQLTKEEYETDVLDLSSIQISEAEKDTPKKEKELNKESLFDMIESMYEVEEEENE